MYFAIAFALLAVTCTILAFRRHPIYGFYFYLATTFVFPQGRWWGSVFHDLRWALLSAAVTALAIAFHRGKLAAKPLWLSNGAAVTICLYAAWMWLQTLWALDLDDHLAGSSLYVKYVLAFWFVYRIADTKENVANLLQAHVLGCALLGLIAYFTGREGDRLDGVGGPGIDDANTLGMYLVTGALAGAGLVLSQSGWRRYVSLLCLPIIVNGVVLANSRGSFVGLMAGGVVLMFCKAREHRWIFRAFVLVGVVGFVSVMDQAFVDRMFSIGEAAAQDEEADTSAMSRFEVGKAQLRMFLDYPLGAGHRGTAALSTQYLDRKWLTLDKGGDESTAARSSHNTFLTTLVEQGIVGALIFISLLLWIASAALRLRRQHRNPVDPELTTLGAATCGALVVVMVAGLTTDYLLAEVQFWMLAVLVSVLQLIESGASESRAALPGDAASIGSLPANRVSVGSQMTHR